MLPPPACPVRRLMWPAVLLALACSDDPAGTEVSTCATLGPVAEILDNHLTTGGEHVLAIPPEDVVDGLERSYDIQGDNAGHTHTVTVSVGGFAALRAGDRVTVVSSNNGTVGAGHDHTIVLSCP